MRALLGRWALLALATAALALPRSAPAQEGGAAALGQLIAGLGVAARVLVVGAHPDDEDTQLIAFLARGRHVETAYLSLTRGDGGQNLIGNELGEPLGVIRTEELLAARRIDGAKQYFTRAYDFGFSKTAEETFKHWPRDSILRDVVTVVRAFKPHVIVAVFSGTPRDGHGHHQVSGILAREAFDLAADGVRYPTSRTSGHGPWTVTHFYRGQRGSSAGATYAHNVGEYSPLLGRSYAEIAGESRSQHKSQGFGALERKGVVMNYGRREASRLVGPPGESPFFAGIDTTWARFRGFLATAGRGQLDSLQGAIAEARRVYDPFDPSATVAPLARVISHLDRLCPRASAVGPCGVAAASASGSVSGDMARSAEILRARANEALALAAGIAVEATVSREVWPTGDSIPVSIAIYNRGRRALDLMIFGADLPGASGERRIGEIRVVKDDFPRIQPDSSRRETVSSPAPAESRPWWLMVPRVGDMFGAPITGLSEGDRLRSSRAITVLRSAEPLDQGTVNGEIEPTRQRIAEDRVVQLPGAPTPIEIETPVTYRFADPVLGEVTRPAAVAPGISVTLDRAIELVPLSSVYDRLVQLSVQSALAGETVVRVGLRLPQGLVADSATRDVTLSAGGARTVVFRVRGGVAARGGEIAAFAVVGADTSRVGYSLIDYAHIRPQRLYRPATISLRTVDVATPSNLRVAYVPGVGDNVAPVLRQLGLAVTVVAPSVLDSLDLSGVDVVVIGPRAYEAHPELVAANQRLLDWTGRGGTMVVQYGQYEMMRPGIMPAPITIARPHDRVTEEDAPVRMLDPRSPIFTTPNRITPADFDGWVQERSLYMPRTFDAQYRAILSMNDPNEPANEGAILVMPHGAGTYVYTTLAFFRQLPAGVPGAARLFANLLAASRAARPGAP